MSLAFDSRVDDQTYVLADLTYLRATGERPMSYTYEPPAGTPRQTGVFETRTVPIHDARKAIPDASVDRDGFELLDHESAVRNFHDDEEIRAIYYPETERLLRDATGASRIFVFDHTVRQRTPNEPLGSGRTQGRPRGPAARVHVDHTEQSGPRRLRDFLGDEADEFLQHRFAVINLWRPIRGPLEDAPLAVCDARSVPFSDLVGADLVYRDRVGETYSVKFNPLHRWYYYPRMRTDEALLLKCYDSNRQVARFAPHGAFEDPTTPPNAIPRESIELRTFAFYPD